MNKSIGFFLDKEEKQLLEAIAEQDGRASMSAILRKLIRKEATERGIKIETTEAVAANE